MASDRESFGTVAIVLIADRIQFRDMNPYGPTVSRIDRKISSIAYNFVTKYSTPIVINQGNSSPGDYTGLQLKNVFEKFSSSSCIFVY
jgi:hypothetical protein